VRAGSPRACGSVLKVNKEPGRLPYEALLARNATNLLSKSSGPFS
jgi:hypothetical protein